VTFGRYAVPEQHSRHTMKREFSTDHIHYDPVSGYLHKFRLDGSQDPRASDATSAEERVQNLPLFIAGAIAVGLILVIGVLTL
jgi:hypothetical protein